eukprot:TRINITY_DN185_c0_g1_i1.p1 TRINITY_DN185_c0_g1~~TRINITY_DN185_c0_g1_i1.p1  ORF type:complete len:1214 (+),score=437.05 TRINITY_DN185_c0_g1_i1:175-3642(+)
MQFAKPENALKRAEELIGIERKPEALTVLHSVITAKKFRTWQPVLEKILLKYVSLCVELKKGRLAKEGLHQYKLSCQQYNIASLEVVVKHFLAEADAKAQEAQSKAEKITLDAGLDLDEADEDSIIIGTSSADDLKNRTDREVVTPWLKFLWDTYRNVLEILRNNNKLESLYQDTAKRAFDFCLKYKRNNEFRRLSEMLRTHLANIGKYQNQTYSVNLSSPESLQLHLNARFAQLTAASKLELWGDAFRSIEDIHGLIIQTKKVPKPTVQASYFQHLAQVFWMSDNRLFHAYALNKYYQLAKSVNKNMTEDEHRVLATNVALAILSIPLEKRGEDDIFGADLQKEKADHMASLMSFTSNPASPSRKELVNDLLTKILPSGLVDVQLQDLYELLEKNFAPLKFAGLVRPKLDYIASTETTKQYHTAIQGLFVVRLLQQLSRVFENIRIPELLKQLGFAEFSDAEKIIVESVKAGHVEVTIDHQAQVLNFRQKSLESDLMRNQLKDLARNLQNVVQLIQPTEKPDLKARKHEMFARILSNLNNEHQRILARKRVIEVKKENIEDAKRKAAQADKAKRDAQAKALAEAEQQRLAQQMQERARQKAERDALEKKEHERKIWIDMLQRKAERDGEQIDISGLENPDDYVTKKIEQHKKAQLDMVKRLKTQAKLLDWLERAKRSEERPLLEEQYKKQLVEDEKFATEQREQMLTTHREQYEKDKEEAKRHARFRVEKDAFEAILMKRREEEYKRAKAEYDAKIAEIKQQRRAEREERRRLEDERQAEIERQQALEEEEERKREEAAAKKREADEKRRDELAEQRRKNDEVARKQREREEEVARKRQEEEAAANAERTRRRDEDRRQEPTTWRRGDREEPPARDSRDAREGEREAAPPASGRYVPPAERARMRGDGDRRPDDRRPIDRDDHRPIDRDDRRPIDRDDRRPIDRDDRRPFDRDDRRPADRGESRGDRWESSRVPDRVSDSAPERASGGKYVPPSARGERWERDAPRDRDFRDARDSRDSRDGPRGGFGGGFARDRDSRDFRDSRDAPRDRDFGRDRDFRDSRDGPRDRDFGRDAPRDRDGPRDFPPRDREFRRSDSADDRDRRDAPRPADDRRPVEPRRDEPRRDEPRRDERAEDDQGGDGWSQTGPAKRRGRN